MIKETGIKVLETSDYEIFKVLEGNREVLDGRVRRILDSFRAVGQIKAPIIVNEKYEVIDGGGRLAAARKAGFPVYFIVLPGIGLKECIAMNVNQKNWAMIDYVKSYADTGNQSYIYLQNLCNEFGANFSISVVVCAAKGTMDVGSPIIKGGRFFCDKESYEKARESLLWLTQFTPIFSKIKGRVEAYYTSLLYCFSKPDIDNKRLYEKIVALQATIVPVATVVQALEQIETMYNRNYRDKVYIGNLYRRDMDSKYKWYEPRHMRDKEGEE